MAKLKICADGITRETYFKAYGTGVEFRRTAGSIVWPHGELPGCIVVLGETRSRQNFVGNRRHDAHLLEEFESVDTAELVDMLGILTLDWHIRTWATPICDQRAWLLEDAIHEQRKNRRRIWRYADPQGWNGKGEGLLPFYHALIQRRTLSEKTLFLGRGSACADEVGKLAFEDKNKSILEYPAAAAACFALAEFDLNPRGEWGERRRDNDAWGAADTLGGY